MTWRESIKREMSFHADHFDDIISEVSDISGWMDVEFDESYGIKEGPSFTLWTKKRVYFPVQYDGSEWVGSVPRDPCNEITRHMGGG